MADAITNTPGSEKVGSKVVVIIASIIAMLGTLTTILDSVTAFIPPAQKGLGLYLAIGGTVIAGLTQIAYTVQRGWVKVAAINAGAVVPPAGSTDPATAAANLAK